MAAAFVSSCLCGNHLRALEANVLHGVHVLQRSEPVLAAAIARGDLRVVGGVYHMHTGEVRWLEE